MLSSLASLPLSVVSSTASFFTSRRRGFTYAAGVVGAAYLAGKWALEKVGESAEKARREGWGREDLARRFSLNLQDSQFTVLALLPTLQSSVLAELDVESRTKELADRARREREAKKREEEERWRLEAAEAARVEEERLRAVSEADDKAVALIGAQGETETESTPNGDSSASTAVDDSSSSSSAVSTAPASDSHNAPALDPTAPSFVFNPSAPSFKPGPSSLEKDYQPRSETEEAFPPLPATSNGVLTNGNRDNGHVDEAEKAGEQEHDSEKENVSMNRTAEQEGEGKKSWAAVVQENVPATASEQDEKEERSEPAIAPTQQDTVPSTALTSHVAEPSSASEGAASSATAMPNVATENGLATALVEEEVVVPNPLAEKSKAELWHEIKILAFTRLLTSLYLLPFLTLQTHVHLALLGRSSYVNALVETLPPRSPSPPLFKGKSLPSLSNGGIYPPKEVANDLDLEKALLKSQQLPLTLEEQQQLREEERQDVERKYLTFSWWLLHEGWKVVEQRVKEAVEEVVGPLGLKTPLVYGELGALFGQLRRKIELDEETGKAFDFSSVLHPPSPQLELQTLISGGSYTPPPATASPSSPPSRSPSLSYPPTSSAAPAPSASTADPISPALRALLSETSDALDSPDAALVRALMLDKLFSLVIEKLEPAFRAAPTPAREGEGEGDRGARFEDVTERTAKLAGLLPVLTRLTSEEAGGGAVLGTGLEGSEWVEALEEIRELREFSAVVYGSWDREDVRASCVV
ncbi:hypothetical protein JCM11251_001640 [Rhodosporidiobolus azoricus]